MQGYYVGIDFGTTNSSVAVLDPLTGTVEVKKVDAGEQPLLIRSILSCDFDGSWIIGNQAAALHQLRQRSVFSLKTELRTDLNFAVTIDDDRYKLEDLIARFLKELLNKAGIDRPNRIRRLALSVPVHYDDNRKRVMEQAASLIGIRRDHVWFLDEPVSVMWDCGNVPGRYMLVFDFGGGTLDMAIMDKYAAADGLPDVVRQTEELPDAELVDKADESEADEGHDNRYRGRVLAKVGLDLGGDDLDDVIIRYFMEEGRKQGNPVCINVSPDVFDDPVRLNNLRKHPRFTFYYQLKALAEKMKKQLSTQDRVTLDIPPLMPGADNGISAVTFTLEQFIIRTEKLRAFMMSGLKKLNDQFVEATGGLNRQHVDAVLLSGGSSLVAFVPDILEELYPNARIVWDEQHLQTRIARGNARYTRGDEEILVGDPINASYGLYSHADKETVTLIEETERYPIRKERRIATTKPNQQVIELVPMVRRAGSAFEPLRMDGRPVSWRMHIKPHSQTRDLSRISVSFSIDKSQRLRVQAFDHLFNTDIGVEEVVLTERP